MSMFKEKWDEKAMQIRFSREFDQLPTKLKSLIKKGLLIFHQFNSGLEHLLDPGLQNQYLFVENIYLFNC